MSLQLTNWNQFHMKQVPERRHGEEPLKAIKLRAFGGPETLICEEIALPSMGQGEVLVKIACCGVCHLDLILRSGMRSRVSLPRVLGHELAGEVVATGLGVNGFAAGDRVTVFNFQACGECADCLRGRPSLCRFTKGDIGQTRDGGYAEYAVLDAANLVRLPDGMAMEEACFAACVYGPPYKAIRKIGDIQPGHAVVITGASGGLGLAAIQIVNALGGRAIAITGSPGKVQLLKEKGASDVVVSPDGNFGEDVRALTDGRGVDLVVELTGSPTFAGTLRSLAPGGRCAVIGELHGTPVSVNLGLLIIKELRIEGVQSASRGELREILDFMHANGIKPEIWRRMPLAEAAEAHRQLHKRGAVGRILLVP
ncbi:NADPH:quinone reductase-like Zn-dependent oxidoreductase [Neorhizobium galegae]|uniref:alcohol dehydrogenase catalytic domain-containing protein n=1 Tax=Neorhizobium galegae TaxID=399 RepID=UPI00278124D3|nr:alcohol dehydrogenase catalytic domain-containing protein [Neorhizobium galegae]MDQ0134923.1 NADPH:quinone reductase-like Zn-dependent oxidoreductase [Neorhizobium galegae]